MGTLHNCVLIVRVGRNQNKKVGNEPNKSFFTRIYSHATLQVIEYMHKRFPLLSYRVWELSWLNEFFNHQLAHNQIFVEVEKEGCDFVFSAKLRAVTPVIVGDDDTKLNFAMRLYQDFFLDRYIKTIRPVLWSSRHGKVFISSTINLPCPSQNRTNDDEIIIPINPHREQDIGQKLFDEWG